MSVITILKADGKVLVDGVVEGSIDMSDLPSNVHAVQWFGSAGEIEYVAVNGVKPANTPLDIFDDYSQFVTRWQHRRDAYYAGIAQESVTTVEQRIVLVRADRDFRLQTCDWTQLPDVSETVRTQWQAYRQALRDVPEQSGFPDSVAWPTAPSA